jgi:undecaprenyl-diphosphatase
MSMNKKPKKKLYAGAGLLIAFILWTVAVGLVDVQTIGPLDTAVGFATVNRFVHDLTGVHLPLYTITDWLGLVPLGVVAGFGILGLTQWIRRKRLSSVDADILVLGGFYVAVLGVFLLFELLAVNYRPILIEGRLEASYPSSTTMLAMCVMPTAMMQMKKRIRNPLLRRICLWSMAGFTAFMVIGRLISGVHWLTDIVGGGLFSAGLVLLYGAVCDCLRREA